MYTGQESILNAESNLSSRGLPSFPVRQACLGGFLLLVLLTVVWPSLAGVADGDARAKALYQAKQVSLALKLFAGDNDDVYPSKGVPPEMTKAPASSNAAFACLFPLYVTSEKIFGNPLSAYQTREPDNIVDPQYTGKPDKTLEPGENVYSYVMGLTDADDPRTPLVVDGTDGHGLYATDPGAKGGVWSGVSAIVVRLDCSGWSESLAGPENARYVPRADDPARNLLDFSSSGKKWQLLDPAVGKR